MVEKQTKKHLNADKINSEQYLFDKVFERVSSEKIYKSEVKNMVKNSLESEVDTTIVAYGQTCAGKTYTLLGVRNAPGFIPCVLKDIFSISKQEKHRYSFRVSYI